MSGSIVILNGVPRSGKTSIAKALPGAVPGLWVNLGVDLFMHALPARLAPGVGLRPGGERPDLEVYIPRLYAAMFESIAAHCRQGFHVGVDVGLHDDYSEPLGILPLCAERLNGLPVLFVGVRCPIEEIMRRRNASDPRRYAGGVPEAPPPPVLRWQSAVHNPGVYDLEVDTSQTRPEDAAGQIRDRLAAGAGDALWRAAEV